MHRFGKVSDEPLISKVKTISRLNITSTGAYNTIVSHTRPQTVASS